MNRSNSMRAAMPTLPQAGAGNFRMGHIRMHGLAISIETPKGRRRRPEWPPMGAHYGYIKGTEGNDGDHLDVFIGPDRSSELVFVVDQSGASGKRFDEHKVMLGFRSREEAIAAYKCSYKPGWTVGPVTAMTIDQFKAWLRGGNMTKPVSRQVSRYALIDQVYDLHLAFDDSSPVVDHYEWRAEEHPRHEAGSPGGIGGEFAPTGQASSGGNRPGGSLSPRMLESAQQKAWISSDPAKHLQPVEPYKPLPPLSQPMDPSAWMTPRKPVPAPGKSTRLREIAALPDTITEGHALHLSELDQRDRADLLDWSNRLKDAMAKVQGPNEEVEWQNVDKRYIRALLEEMNQRDRVARAGGVRLSDYVNANGLIPEALATRLSGGARFFDPEKIRHKIQAGMSTPQKKHQVEAKQKQQAYIASVIDEFRRADRDRRKFMQSDASPDTRDVLLRARGIIPPPRQPAQEGAPDKPTEQSPKPTESAAKPTESAKPSATVSTPESLHSAIKSVFDSLPKAHQKKVDQAIRGMGDDMPSDMISELREEVLSTWKEMTSQAQEHNAALRGVMANFGKHWGLVSARLKKGDDYDSIKGFDQMADYARNNYPQLLAQHQGASDTGSAEENLAKALREGLRSVPNPWDDEVIEATRQRVEPAMAGAGGDYPEFAQDPDDPDYVPFSVQSIVDEVMRYWLEETAHEKLSA